MLKAVLHSILFHRLFGTIKPQSMEILDVTMASALTTLVRMRSLIDVTAARRKGYTDRDAN